MSSPMSRTLAVLGLAVLPVAVACGDETTGPGETLVGVFNLTMIDSGSLPFTLFQVGDNKLEMVAGRIVFQEGGQFTSVAFLRETIGGQVTTSTEEVNGTYTRRGNTLTLDIPDDEDSPYSATLSSGNVITFAQDGLVYRFELSVGPGS